MAELRHEGSYVTIHAGPVARTVQIRPDLHVDLCADGRVIGVERVGAPVSVGDLAAVLFVLPLPPHRDRGEQRRRRDTMRKIPTLFIRDAADMRHVTREVHPDCEWVLDGAGVATRKYDGTCVMLDDDGQWWARREVKPRKKTPDVFVPVQHDEVTGKTVGWEPIEQSAFAKYHAQALDARLVQQGRYHVGTYELCGPKVNGNPEHFPEHRLIRHEDAETFNLPPRLDYATCRRAVLDLAEFGHEGIVWHHPDGRMAKLKRRDFPPSP